MRRYRVDKQFWLISHVSLIRINRFTSGLANIFLTISKPLCHSKSSIGFSQTSISMSDDSSRKMYCYTPKIIDDSHKCILFFHGGGFLLRMSSPHFAMIKKMAEMNRCKVFMIDYRLTPKYKYKTLVDDCLESYKWMLDNLQQLEINKNEIIFMGDSAGGYLSLSTIIHSSRNGWPLPCKQLLIYPVVDYSMSSDSMKEYTRTPVWNAKLNKRMWTWLVDEANKNRAIIDNPLLDENTRIMPPTYVEVADFDCLRDEGILLYEKMKNSNKICFFHKVNGSVHGYDTAQRSSLVKECYILRKKFLDEK